MTEQPIETAPKDPNAHIEVYAELGSKQPQNAFNDWVRVHWDPKSKDWALSDFGPDTHIDSPITKWRPIE